MSEQEHAGAYGVDGTLLTKLAPIVDALRRRGAVSQEINLWPDENNTPNKVNFVITAVFGFDGLRLEAEWCYLAERLSTSDFQVRRPLPEPGNNTIYMVASMAIAERNGGKSSRKGGKRAAPSDAVVPPPDASEL
jgi:hypothetical protein